MTINWWSKWRGVFAAICGLIAFYPLFTRASTEMQITYGQFQKLVNDNQVTSGKIIGLTFHGEVRELEMS